MGIWIIIGIIVIGTYIVWHIGNKKIELQLTKNNNAIENVTSPTSSDDTTVTIDAEPVIKRKPKLNIAK